MMKRINIKNFIILGILLAVFHYGVGLVVSPAMTTLVVDTINTYSDGKVHVGRFNAWPLTLSVTMKDLRVSDPDNIEERIIMVEGASARVSLLGLLSKKLVLDHINLSGVDINLVGEPDGSFNIDKLAKSQRDEERKSGAWSLFKKLVGKKDLFARVYNMIKSRFSKEGKAQAEADSAAAAKVNVDIEEIPHGRRVVFRTGSDDNIIQIKELDVRDCRLRVIPDKKNTIDIEKAKIEMSGLAFNRETGVEFDGLNIKGVIKKNEAVAGNLKFYFKKELTKKAQTAEMEVSAKDVDLSAVSFTYDDSLPVLLDKGTLDLYSKTNLVDDAIDSENRVVLSGHNFVPKKGLGLAFGVVPMPILCDALNQLEPVNLKFQVKGTLENPEFSNLKDVIMTLIQPYVDKVKQEGTSAFSKFFNKGQAQEGAAAPEGESKVTTTINKFKSLFGTKEESQPAADQANQAPVQE